MVKIIRSEMDTLRLDYAKIEHVDGSMLPVATVSGIRCNIDTKPGPLADGMAYCQPLDSAFADAWPMSVVVRFDGGAETVLWNMTTDPGIVKAARRWADLESRGLVRVGVDLLR